MRAVAFALTFGVLGLGCDHRPSVAEMRKARQLISVLDRFVAEHGRSPDDPEGWGILRSLGLPDDESCRPCYGKSGPRSYEIWFGMRLGESYAYSSEQRVWGIRD